MHKVMRKDRCISRGAAPIYREFGLATGMARAASGIEAGGGDAKRLRSREILCSSLECSNWRF